jgi:predicted MFS family arabinose efflux permease
VPAVGSAGWRCWRLRPSIVLLAVTLAGSGLAILPPIERPDGPLTAASALVFGLTGAASRWRAGVLADRIGSRMLFPSSLGAAAVRLLGIAARLLSNAAGFDAGLVVAGTAVFGYGAVLNLGLLVAFARAGRGSATIASAVWNASFDIGFGVGALAWGRWPRQGPVCPGPLSDAPW